MKALTTLALSLLLCASPWARAGDLSLYTEDSPPLNYVENGKLDGASVAVVKAIQARIGDTTPIAVVPWARSYKALETEPNIALFSTTRTEQREGLFQWVGPIGYVSWVFVKKKGSPLHIGRIEDARKVRRIGTYLADAREQWLKGLGFTNLDSATSDSLNCKKLVMGRVDAWLTGDIDLPAACKVQGIARDDVEIAYVARKQELYIAFSKSTPPETVQKWQQGYDAIVKDGTFRAIHKQYGILVF